MSGQAAAAARAFFGWWSRELTALLPIGLRRPFCETSSLLVLDFGARVARLIQCAGGVQKELGSYPLDPFSEAPPRGVVSAVPRSNLTTVVLLPPEDVLAPVLTLPAEAESNLREVLGYEMDRQTPFSAEQVYYDYLVEERLTDVKRIRVRATVAPRDLVNRLVQTAVRWGFQPAVVSVGEVQLDPEHPLGESLNLLPTHERAARRSSRGLNRLLGVTAVLLTVAVVALPMHRQGEMIKALEAQVATVSGEAREVQALRQEVERLGRESSRVVQRKLGSPRVIDALNELSILLPDDTWLQRFELKGNSLTLHGESLAASALIAVLEGSIMFQGATFRSPVVRDPRSGRDRFQIVVEVIAGRDGDIP